MHTETNTTRLLVSSCQAALGDFLRSELSATAFCVIAVQPGTAFVEAVRRERPPIVVLDLVPERLEAVRVEIATVKQMCPQTRIIAISEQSTAQDAEIVEAGVFFYLATQTQQPHDLLRVIAAAAQGCSVDTRESAI